ncbi:MAG: heavy metal translocating P-type ATPase [Rhodobacteraceae bacterium]|nr:heavy metal translocating P-type ATPase [Paracoccaceae bacterium]
MPDGSTLTVHVEGMTCASCVARVERALSAVPGVTSASVNLATSTATVAGGAGAAEISAALRAAGYAVPARTLVLDVEGMTCASCVARVERALAAVPGVTGAVVNLADGTARVTGLSGAVDPAPLLAAVRRAGYAAHVRPSAGAGGGESGTGPAARRFAVAALLTAPVFLLEMGGHLLPGFHHQVEAVIGQDRARIAQFVLVTAVLLWPGRTILARGLPALWRGHPDMNALVAVGTLSAWAYSTLVTFAPGLLPAEARAVYFEAAAVIVTLILLGRWLEARAKGRAGDAIRRLVGLRPATALVERDGRRAEIRVEDIVPGDVLHVRPGERIAVDGVVTAGESWVDESMLTGEPTPRAAGPGAALAGGTVNGNGALVLRATRVGADTVLARIIRMVDEAQGSKLPVQDLVNRVAEVFVPAVILVALLAVAGWLAFGPAPRLTHALVAGVSVLIVACPCAMGLATPTSILVGTGRAAELGVYFRRAAALQTLAAATTIAFDKTGTLTEGHPVLAAIAPGPDWTADALLAHAAAVERHSEHPLARAIVAAAAERGLDLPPASGFRALPGQGARAEVAGRAILVGSRRFLERAGVATGDAGPPATGTEVCVAVDGRHAGTLRIDDRIRPGAAAVLAELRAMGLGLALVTGDNAAAAGAVAAELGIDRVVAEVLPEGKVAALRALGPGVAFVGDGINDAPVLAAADPGIAVGSGTDVAIESADVVLMSGDLNGVLRAVAVARATMRNIRQNLVWAFGYNVLLLPVAAGLLYPVNGLRLSPALAAGAMAASSLLVLTNALRLRRAGGPGPGARPAPRPGL